MYDYMKALQKRFDRQEHSKLTPRSKAPMRNCGGTWTPRGAENCRLLDTQNTLLVEAKLMSFTAGFAGVGMAKELEADGLYSFEQEEEEHICHPAEQED